MKIKFLFLIFTTFLLLFLACENTSSTQKESEPEVQPLSEATQKEYLEKGKAIAGSTFTALSLQLQNALGKGGVEGAIQYCNLAAFPMVDSLSKEHKAHIKRTSLKIRNPKDAPNAQEKAILEDYHQQAAAGEQLKPKVLQGADQTISFYAPIKVNAFCLQCHGKKGETLAKKDFQTIQKIYPDDQAIGYKDGDLRGMWSISFATN